MDEDSAWLLGQHCANAFLDGPRWACAADEHTIVTAVLADPAVLDTLAPCTRATLRGYRDALGDYLAERADA